MGKYNRAYIQSGIQVAMKVKPVVHFTSDGREILIREAVPEDALNLLNLKKSYIRNTKTIPMYEFEYKNDILAEKALIERYAEPNSLLLVAEHGNNLVGNLDLTGSLRKKMYHTGMIGMGITYEWQNRKIGSFLMREAIQRAKTSVLEIIWLEVYSTNTAGRRLYQKFGFEECGTVKNFFKEERYADKITMVKHLK